MKTCVYPNTKIIRFMCLWYTSVATINPFVVNRTACNEFFICSMWRHHASLTWVLVFMQPLQSHATCCRNMQMRKCRPTWSCGVWRLSCILLKFCKIRLKLNVLHDCTPIMHKKYQVPYYLINVTLAKWLVISETMPVICFWKILIASHDSIIAAVKTAKCKAIQSHYVSLCKHEI